MINITIPAYNEDKILEQNIKTLYEYLKNNLLEPWFLVIANNGSTDMTADIGQDMAKYIPGIKYVNIDKPGKGRAVFKSWQTYPADIYSFMDADLSTDIDFFPKLIEQIHLGADIAVGSRHLYKSKVEKSFHRKITSQGLKWILRIIIHTKITDAPCGFKAINQKTSEQLVPQVLDKKWFFDTEMLLLAEKKGFNIKEIPIIWKEPDRQSKVKVVTTAFDYLQKIYKVKKRLFSEKINWQK